MSALIVCGESNKDFSLRTSSATVVVLLLIQLDMSFLSEYAILSPGQNLATSKCGVYKTQAG